MITFNEMETRINNSEIIDPVIDQDILTRPSQYTKEEFMSKCPGIWPRCDQEAGWLDEWMEEYHSGCKESDYVAIDKMMLDHFREKAEDRRVMYQGVFYALMILMGIVIWFVAPETHWGWKVLMDVVLVIISFYFWAIYTAKEIDQSIPLSPDEMIMQEELKRRSKP